MKTNEIERELLGKIIFDNNIYYSIKLRPEMFKDANCRKVFEASGELLGAKMPVNIHELFLKLSGQVDASFIATLTNEIHTKVGWEKLEKEISSQHKKGKLKQLNYELSSRIEKDPEETISFLFDEIEKIIKDDDRNDIQDIKNIISEQMKIYEERYNRRGALPGIESGFESLDSRFSGFQKERLYYICARPSQGKSALMMNMSINIGISGLEVGIISLESSRTEITDRSIAYLGKINSSVLTSGMYNPSVMCDITDSASKLYESKIFIYDKPNLYLDELKQTARRMKMIYGIKILFVDYLQLIRVKGAQTKSEQVMEASISLKDMARELKIPIVALAQLGRDSDEKRPSIGDIQWSSQAEQDADGIVLLQAGDQKYTDDNQQTGTQYFNFYIDKSRDGAKGFAGMEFTGKFLEFKESDRQLEEPKQDQKKGRPSR